MSKPEVPMKSIVDKILIKGRVAIVTGGHSGIGRGIVEALSQAGANIAIVGRRNDLGNQVAQEIRETNGVEAVFINADVTRLEDIHKIVAETLCAFGKIDILVNNAGICHHENAETVNYDNWRRVMDVNLDGLFFLSQAVGKVMIEQRSGCIINISSNSDNLVMTPQTQTGYNASKSGVDMVTRCLAYEWAKYNIRVNAIAPGYIKSDIWPEGIREDGKSWTDVWLDMIPIKRFGLAEEIGALALFMASDMAPFMTGSVVLIDGGYSLT
jgi:NAD(P)-dependent dehydrogenase (short-subunit alcohol dehydrogenase family)